MQDILETQSTVILPISKFSDYVEIRGIKLSFTLYRVLFCEYMLHLVHFDNATLTRLFTMVQKKRKAWLLLSRPYKLTVR